MLISFLVLTEIIVLNVGIYAIIRRECDSVSRSFCYSAILTLAALSISIQAFFLLEIPGLYFIFDIVIIVFSVFHIFKNKDLLKKDVLNIFKFLGTHRLILFIVLPIAIFLFLQAFLLPPGNSDSMVYNLARVLMFEQAGGLFLENYSMLNQAAFPVGFDILSFLFLRFNSDFGLAVFSFLSYIVVISGTFSLAASFFNKKKVLNVSIIIASLTELVLQSTNTKNDIPCAAAAVVIFLAGYIFLKNRGALDLYLLIATSLWGLTIKSYFPGFVLPFFLFYTALLIKPLSFKGFLQFLTSLKVRFHYSALLPLGLIVCMAFFYGNNIKRFGNIWGEKVLVKALQNNDGILGGVINAGRYLVQSAEIPVKYGYKINGLHDRLLQGNKTAGLKNMEVKIDLADKAFFSEDYTWYGPLGFFLVLPAIIFSIFLGKGYIRMVGLTLLLFFIIVSYQLVWMPWNNRFFSLFFAGSGLCIAYVFNRFLWMPSQNRVKAGFKLWGERIIILVTIYGLLSAALQNGSKLTVPQHQSRNLFYNLYAEGAEALHIRDGRSKTGWFTWLANVVDRKAHYRRFYPAHMLDTFVSGLEKGKKVLLLGFFAKVFPLLFSRPDLDITVSTLNKVSLNHKVYNLNNPNDYRVLREHYDYLVVIDKNIKKFGLFKNIRAEKKLFYSIRGSIYKVKKL